MAVLAVIWWSEIKSSSSFPFLSRLQEVTHVSLLLANELLTVGLCLLLLFTCGLLSSQAWGHGIGPPQWCLTRPPAVSASTQAYEPWSARETLTVNAVMYWKDCGLRKREPLTAGNQQSKEMPVAMESVVGDKRWLKKKKTTNNKSKTPFIWK